MTHSQDPAIKPPQEPGYSLSMAVLCEAYPPYALLQQIVAVQQ